jgi:hypothetical protein
MAWDTSFFSAARNHQKKYSGPVYIVNSPAISQWTDRKSAWLP